MRIEEAGVEREKSVLGRKRIAVVGEGDGVGESGEGDGHGGKMLIAWRKVRGHVQDHFGIEIARRGIEEREGTETVRGEFVIAVWRGGEGKGGRGGEGKNIRLGGGGCGRVENGASCGG